MRIRVISKIEIVMIVECHLDKAFVYVLSTILADANLIQKVHDNALTTGVDGEELSLADFHYLVSYPSRLYRNEDYDGSLSNMIDNFVNDRPCVYRNRLRWGKHDYDNIPLEEIDAIIHLTLWYLISMKVSGKLNDALAYCNCMLDSERYDKIDSFTEHSFEPYTHTTTIF
jgi:hypothetical protein